MKTKDAYNEWAGTYDKVENQTRDLEAIVLKTILGNRRYNHILELGCGTGKNTEWLASKCNNLTAVDFSEEMITQARKKLLHDNVSFKQADITQPWDLNKAGLVTCSLVLEHIFDLDHIFGQAYQTLESKGHFYICELHPYKQLQGSRARFELKGETILLEYFTHHLSEYFQTATKNGFTCLDIQEWFDSDAKDLPRLCSFLFEKKQSTV